MKATRHDRWGSRYRRTEDGGRRTEDGGRKTGEKKRGLRRQALCLGLGLGLLVDGAVGICAAQSGAQHDHGSQAALREYEIKGALLYRVMEYVEWPEASGSNQPAVIRIGLLGQIPCPEALELIDGKVIQGRKLVVKRLSSSQEATRCQAVFIGASEKPRVAEIIGELKQRPVLTVSEVEGFAERGGMVNFLAGRNQVVLEVNRQAASQARLTLSSELLKVAKLVPR